MNIDPAVADCRLQGTANSPSSTAHLLYHSLRAKDKLFISNKKALRNVPKRIARTGFEPVSIVLYYDECVNHAIFSHFIFLWGVWWGAKYQNTLRYCVCLGLISRKKIKLLKRLYGLVALAHL